MLSRVAAGPWICRLRPSYYLKVMFAAASFISSRQPDNLEFALVFQTLAVCAGELLLNLSGAQPVMLQ